MEDSLKKAKEILKKYNQEHLLSKYEKLNNEKKEYLLNQILNINFDQINALYKETKKEIKFEETKIDPIKYVDKSKFTKEECEKYFEIGANEIRNGKFAVVTMAGRTRNKTWTYWTKRNIYIKCKTKTKIFI